MRLVRGIAAAAILVLVPVLVVAGTPRAQGPAYNADCAGTPCRIERLLAPWEVTDVGLNRRTLSVAFESGGCWRGDTRVTGQETPRRIGVTVTQLRVVAAATPSGELPCASERRYGTVLLLLRQPVGGRAIDGAPRIGAHALPPARRMPWVLDMRAADAARALHVQGLRVRRLGRATGRVAFESPLPSQRVADAPARLTVGRHLFRPRALDGCLERAGMHTIPRVPKPGDADAPDLVLWLRHPDAMASVGLYRDPARARELAPLVRRAIRRAHGVFERRSHVTIGSTGLTRCSARAPGDASSVSSAGRASSPRPAGSRCCP